MSQFNTFSPYLQKISSVKIQERRTEIFELKKLLPYSSYSVLLCSLVLTGVRVSRFALGN